MLDFVIEGHVPVWIWLLYFLVLTTIYGIGVNYINGRGYLFRENNKKSIGFLLFFTFFTLCYCLNPDFFAYRDFAHGDYKWFFLNSEIKDIEGYYYVALLCNGNFELFRIIIWGGAYLVFYFTCKILKVPTYLSLLIFFMLFNDVASYGRVTLAMAIYFLGLAIIFEKKWYILGILVTLSSVFFHHSMVVAIAVIPLIFTPKNKTAQIVLYLIIFVVMSFVITKFMGEADNMMEDESLGYFGRKMTSSQNKIEEGIYSRYGGIFGVINDFMRFLVFYVPLIGFYSKVSKNKRNYNVPQSIVLLYRVTIGIALLATGFLVFYQSFNVLFYRTLYMCMIPISIIMASLLANHAIKKDFVNITLAIAYIHFLGLYLSHI